MKQLSFDGECTFTVDFTSINLRVGRISNHRSGGVSGTLALRLWALASRYSTGTLRGFVAASSKVPPLAAGASISNVNENIPAEEIPSGYYYPALTLEEHDSASPNGWLIMDIHAFDEPAFFGKRMVATGLRTRSKSATELEVSLGEVLNQTNEMTGPLRATVWATREPYDGGVIRGFKLATKELGSLPGKERHRNLVWTVERQGGGRQGNVAVLLLEERRSSQASWQLQDYCSADIPPIAQPQEHDRDAHESDEPEIKEEDLIGQGSAKAALQQVIALTRVNEERRRRAVAAPRVTLHAAFVGSPGTGKTTFARFYTQQIRALGLLPRGHMVEVSRPDLVAEYSGQTATRTAKAVESARGGVLFIDEAYALKQSKDDAYGQECIDTLVKKMEDHRDDLVVIFAGYSEEMREFLRQNTGLESRVPNVIEFEDFNDSELEAILDTFCRRAGVSLSPAVRRHAVELIARGRRGRSFGNARDVRNVFERALAQQSVRLARLDLSRLRPDELSELQQADFTVDTAEGPSQRATGATAPGNSLTQLDALVGLANVKAEMRELSSLIRVERLRHPGRGLPTLTLHRLYAGAPGTGKKTVARVFGALLYELGLLARGHVREVSRADLVGGFLGQTSLKTRDRVQEAMGGILYLSEASALWSSGDQYDRQAIDSIMEAAEKHRDQLVVILSDEAVAIERVLRADPRVQTAFGKPVRFEDPGDDDLVEIARRMAKSRGYHLAEGACALILSQLVATRARSGTLANAREVRNLLDRAYLRQAVRLEASGDPAGLALDLLHTLDARDFAAETDKSEFV